MTCQRTGHRPSRSERRRDQREIHVDAGRRILAVFQFGFRQGRAIRDAPVNRLELPADEARFDQVGQDVENARLVSRVERQVGIVPVAHDAESFELAALDVDPLHGLGLAQGSGSGRGSSLAALEPRSLTTLCSIGRP